MSYIGGRRSPYPYHIKIDGQGFMLGQGKPGAPQLVSTRVQDFSNISASDYSYASWSPLGERVEAYESLPLGMGMRMQETAEDKRYASAQGVDASVWPWCKGPEITLFTPAAADATAGVVQFFELGATLYCANGRYILRRDGDATWTMVKDFGAGIVVQNLTVFTSNADGVQRAFVALSSGPAQHSSNGTTWTPFATFAAIAFAAIGREFWLAEDTNRLRKCDTNADPTNEANYTSLIFRVGDKSSRVMALMVSAIGTLVIAKTDGLYTLDQAGDDHNLFPFLTFAEDANNGRAWGQYENSLYTAYGAALARLGPELGWQDVGPDKLVNNDSPVRGKVTAFAGVGSMFAYAAVFNPDTLTGYLCKFGAWISQGIGSSSVEPVHIDAWHGSLSAPFTNRAIQTIFVSSIGAPTRHTRTYLGFSDGSIGWLINPCVPNPAACSQYRFATGDAWIELPQWHGGFHASKKALRHFSVTGPRLDAANYVTLEYKTDPKQVGWTAFPNVFDSSTYEVAPIEPVATTVLAQFRIHLVNTAATSSPLVSAIAIGHALRPQRIMQFEGDILCADGLIRRDGVPMRIGRRKIQQLIEAALDNPGAVMVTLPDETTQELSFIDLKIAQAFDEVGRQYRASLHVTAIQHVTQTIEV